jgi:Predicted metal binding domain
MRLDPALNRLKFDREITRLQEQRKFLESHGIFQMASSLYPTIDLLYVPRHVLQVAVPVTQQGGLFLPPGAVRQAQIPSLSASAFKAHFDLANYDLDPPSLEFRDPWTDAPLQYNTMFRALQFDRDRRGQIVLLDEHPVTHRPFLCVRGIREYHDHPQHSGDEWMLYRESMNMFSTAMTLWRVALDLARPLLIIQPDGGGQVQWVGEEKL